MCNLYSSARSQDEIRRTFAVDRDELGNLPPLPGIFPGQMAPVRALQLHRPLPGNMWRR